MTNTSTVNAKAKPTAKSEWIETIKTILIALLIAMTLRFTVAQPFRIPSGSMQPTLMVNDFIIVTKWSYGYNRFSIAPLEGLAPDGRLFGGEPKRGDVIVFRPPHEPKKDFVKRLIGMPGEKIQMKGGVLYIDDKPVQREYIGVQNFIEFNENFPREIKAYRERLPNGVTYTTFDKAENSQFDDTPVFVVPEGHYFMMGDDRDNSDDSRGSVSFVPRDHLVGKAQFVAASFDYGVSLWPWTWFTDFRGERFLKGVD